MNRLKMSRRRNLSLTLPSPVPTGKGLRSSAINDEILSDYLTESLQVPALKLPVILKSRNVVILTVEMKLVLKGEKETIESVKRSGSEFGIVLVNGHGVDAEEMREMKPFEDDEFDFCLAGDEEEDDINPDLRSDSNIRKETELIAIGKSLVNIFYKSTATFGAMQVKALSSLETLNYNVDYQLSSTKDLPNDKDKDNARYCENALNLYLPSSKCNILVQEDGGGDGESFVFQGGPDTIVAILGQQLEVDGNVKKRPRRLRVVPHVDDQKSAKRPAIYSIGLKMDCIISVYDQIILAALIILFFQLVLWIF